MCVIYQKPLLLLCLWLFCALFVPFSRQIFNEVLLVFLLFFGKIFLLYSLNSMVMCVKIESTYCLARSFVIGDLSLL